MPCLDKEQLEAILYDVTKENANAAKVDKGQDKATKFDTFKFSKEMISDFLSGSSFTPTNYKAAEEIMGKLVIKLNGLKNINYGHISTYLDAVSSPNKAVPYNIALKELLDGQTGEYNKMNKSPKVKVISEISSQGVMNIPMARSASVIGRKYLYTIGFRFNSSIDNKVSPLEVEVMYNRIGQMILRNMEKDGLVELGQGQVINDFVEPDANSPKWSEPTRKTQIVRPKIEALVAENDGNIKLYKDIMKGVANPNRRVTTPFDDVNTVINAVNYMKIPTNITLPTLSKLTAEQLEDGDYSTITDTAKEVRQLLHDTPVQINPRMIPYFKALSESWKEYKGGGFKKFVTETFGSELDAYTALGVKPADLYTVDLQASVEGQNRSKLSPLQDLLENFDSLVGEDNKPNGLHMIYNFVRNARLHMMNSVVNGQASPYMRYLITGGENSFYLTNPEHTQHFLSHLLDQGKGTIPNVDLTADKITGVEEDAELNKWVDAYEKYFVNGTNGAHQSNMITNFKGSKNPMATLDTLGAIYDFRQGMNHPNRKVTTVFNTKPDATASGGTITLLQAMAYNPQIEEVLYKLGLLDTDKTFEESLRDVYQLLTDRLEDIKNNVSVAEEGELNFDVANKEKKGMEALNELLATGIYGDLDNDYDKVMREVSKDPTMTFIYNQQRTGAINTIANAITEKLLTSVKQPATRAYISKLLGSETVLTVQEILDYEGIKPKLIKALSHKDGAPAYLREQLESVVTPLIEERATTIFSIYDAISELVPNGKIKILPNMAVLDGVKNTAKNRNEYGIPLAKVMNIIHSTENGDMITMEDRDNKTTSVTNTTHSSDASGLYTGIKRTKDILEANKDEITGMIPVHDENIASTVFNTELMKQYPIALKDSLEVYSIEEQLMQQLEELNPNHPLLAKLKPQVEANVARKKELLAKFNVEDGSVFGEEKTEYKVPKKYIKPKKPTPPTSPKGGKPKKSEAEPTAVEPISPIENIENAGDTGGQEVSSIVRGKELKTILETLSVKSPLIQKFLKGVTKIGKNKKQGFRFNTNTDYVTLGSTSDITGEDIDYESDHFKELVEHEIIHSQTAGYLVKEILSDTPNQAVHYLRKSLPKILDRLVKDEKFADMLSDEAQERLMYIYSKNNEVEQLAEFVAIMGAETAVADSIYSALNQRAPQSISKLKQFIITIYDRVQELIANGELENVEVLQESLSTVIENGTSYKQNNYQETVKFQKQMNNLNANDTDYARHKEARVTSPERVMATTMDRINKTTQNILTSRIERAAIGTGKRVDIALNNAFPIYADVRERVVGIYENNAAVQELISYMNLDNFKNKVLKNEILSKIHNIHEERNARESQQMVAMTNLTADFTKEGKKVLYDMVSKVPLHNFFKNDTVLNNEKDLDDRIAILENSLTAEDISRVDDTVALIVHDDVRAMSMFNTGDYYDSATVDYRQVEELIALKSIKEANLGTEVFNIKDNHVELYNMMKDNSLALSELSFKLSDTNPTGKRTKENLVKDLYDENLEFKVITEDNLYKYDYEETSGWKILRNPTEGNLGVVYREKIDEYFIEGAGVSEDLISPDLTVPSYLAKSHNHLGNNIIKAGNGYKLVLTQEEKIKAGLKEDMIETLVRSASSTIAADDSQVVRNVLLSQAIHSRVDSADGEVVEDILDRINSKTIDHPWTIKLGKNVKYEDLPPRIKGLYKPVRQKLTMIGKFNENVDLVRKDIRPWLVGGHHPSLFKNPKLQYVSRVTKGLISATKIGMISTNPAKLALDVSSNVTHLAMLGVPASKTLRYGKNILGEVNTFNVLKNDVTLLKLKYLASPTEANEKKFNRAVEKLKESSIYGAHENGFMNSLSSDILNNAVGTTTGLQEDIRRVLEYFTTSSGRGNIEKGEKNGFHKLISVASKYGYDGEDMLRFMGKQISRFETKKDFEAYLNKVADNITRMKSQDDVVGYLSQFTVSPNSEFVKAGTWINSMADLSFREIYKRHLMDEGMSEKKAVVAAIEAMPDYKQNMPLSLKVLSDYGILMFPSFFLRTTKPLYDLSKRKLVNVGIEEEMQILLGVDIETLFDANVLEKISQGLLHTPDEYIGVSSILPTNLFNF